MTKFTKRGTIKTCNMQCNRIGRVFMAPKCVQSVVGESGASRRIMDRRNDYFLRERLIRRPTNTSPSAARGRIC